MPIPFEWFSPIQILSFGSTDPLEKISFAGDSHSGIITKSGQSSNTFAAFFRKAMLQFHETIFMVSLKVLVLCKELPNVLRYPRVGGRRQNYFAGANFEPRKLLENAARTHPSGARYVRRC